MKIRLDDLRKIIREAAAEAGHIVDEDLKNVGGQHTKTVEGSHVIRMMHDAPGVMDALVKIDDPLELAHVIEAIIDAVPIVRREQVLRTLNNVIRHEKSTHKR